MIAKKRKQLKETLNMQNRWIITKSVLFHMFYLILLNGLQEAKKRSKIEVWTSPHPLPLMKSIITATGTFVSLHKFTLSERQSNFRPLSLTLLLSFVLSMPYLFWCRFKRSITLYSNYYDCRQFSYGNTLQIRQFIILLPNLGETFVYSYK